MKNKILTFIIGVLVGAILATTGFLVYSKSGDMGEPPDKPEGDFRPQNQI